MYAGDVARLAGFNLMTPFSFDVRCNDSDLLNYSECDQTVLNSGAGNPFSLSDSLFYSDNLSDADGTLLPAFAANAVQTRPAEFSLPLSTPISGAQLTLLDALQQPQWSQSGPPYAADILQINLAGVSEGRYQLQVNGTTELEFYLLQGLAVHQWGALAIYIGGPAQAPYLTNGCPALDAGGAALNPCYSLKFVRRNTIWRYRIFSQTLDLQTWEVTGKPMRLRNGAAGVTGFAGVATAPLPAQQVTFTRTDPVPEQPYWTFQSDQVLPMEARPSGMEFVLSPIRNGVRGSGGGKPIKLPYASGASLVVPDSDKPLNGYSDIYVYL